MPQLVPFYFVHSMFVLLVFYSILLVLLSQYLLPIIPRTQLARLYVVRL